MSAATTRESSSDESPRNGRILTFYSYKGGTGRSMAVANVAWILASAGKRVLAIDWDFEAPGLHRYFHPFLDDPELASTRGLIDYFVDVNVAAREAATPTTESIDVEPWWPNWCSLARYTVQLNWNFEQGGLLDFVPAGQQCSSYGMRVSSTNWHEFYEKLGGGVLLEALKEQLRADYDYVLIDSRTGISDTASICTVQMPDELIVFFTLNSQSVKGAAAVAESAWTQRLKSNGAPGLKVWPVPSRVEMAEKDRLDIARTRAHSTFLRFIELSRDERRKYWEAIEILYYPYYAYEEVLAPFAEGTSSTSSMLRPMEALTRYLTSGTVSAFPRLRESERTKALARFVVATALNSSPAGKERKRNVYISYSRDDREDTYQLISYLNKLGVDTWSDRNLYLGDESEKVMLDALLASSVVLVVAPNAKMREMQSNEVARALRAEKRVVPVLFGAPFGRIPPELITRQAALIDRLSWETDVESLASQLKQLLASDRPEAAAVDAEDPQKGQWGGLAQRNGRELGAEAKSVGDGWYDVRLEVRALPKAPALSGTVKFLLHPTFPRSVMYAPAVDGVASISLTAWGAFTVGAVADDGDTPLELDLASVHSLPRVFRER